MRLADALTVGRALSALPVAALILARHDRAASNLVAIAGFSDLLDGWLARRNGGSRLGPQLDPLADKLLADTALLALAARGRAPWPLVALLVVRDVVVTTLRAGGRDSLAPSTLARLKTGLLYASITWLARGPADSATARLGPVVLWTAAALSAVSGWDYLRRR